MISDWIGLMREGARFRARYDNAVATLTFLDCPELPLFSGALVLEDIDYVREAESFGDYHLNLKPGPWPVRMAVLHFREGTSLFPDGLRQPFLCILGDLNAVATWQSTPRGQPFVQCDRGIVCAFDRSTRPLFASVLLADDDVYFSKMDQAAQEMFSVVIDDDHVAMLMFYAGPGAGSYPIWLGLDSGGQAACVVVDSRAMESFDLA